MPDPAGLEMVAQALADAAHLCLAVRAEMGSRQDEIEKAGREPVTVADFGAQALILRALSVAFPHDAVWAEERADDFRQRASPRQQAQVARHVGALLGSPVGEEEVAGWLEFGRGRAGSRVWAVDPIDGTKGFLRGEQFAVAAALIVDGMPSLVGLACPLLPADPGSDRPPGALALAERGGGATIRPLAGGPARALRVSGQSRAAEARVVESVEAGHSDHAFSAQALARAGLAGPPLRMDSQAKYAVVADGRAEVYLRRSVGEGYAERTWDHAAGALIVAEAGGVVTDVDGKPLDFSAGERLWRNHGILAANPPMHAAVLEAIRALRSRRRAP